MKLPLLGAGGGGTEAYLAYDTFTRANGALGQTEAVGPASEVLTPKTWLFSSGVWAVSSNKAVGTPAVSSTDVITNGDFAADATWTKGTDWTISGGVAVKAAGAAQRWIYQAALTVNKWYQITYTISSYVAGAALPTFDSDGNSTLGVSRAANGTYTETNLAKTVNISMNGSATGDFSLDNYSAKEVTLADLFSSVETSDKDVTVEAAVTFTAGYQAGIVLNLDSDTAPANFVFAMITHSNAGKLFQLRKCVAGVYTLVQNPSPPSYVAGQVLKVVKSGTSYSLYYNGNLLQAAATISDAGIVNNTKHGLFSTNALNQLDGFTVTP